MGTILYGEEGTNPFVKRKAGLTGVEYDVNVNKRMSKREFALFVAKLVEGLDL